MENKNENYKSTTNNCRNLAQMETADDIDRLCITGIVTDVCQYQIFRPGGKSDSGRIYRFITFVTAYGGNIFRNFIAIFGDQYCIECDTGDYRFSDDREKFTSYTVLMIVLNSFLVDLIPVTPITYDPLLVSVFGGILNGTAISIALFGKASSGGTDFIAVYLSSRLHKPSWNFVFGINVVILTTAGFLFGFEAAMYSIIFQFVSTQTINTLHRKDQKATMFIVTRHGAMLEQKIMECTRHGITHLAVQGCYLKEDKDMLYTVLGEDEVKEVTALVHSLDPEAFINIIKSEGIAGRFYEEPLE